MSKQFDNFKKFTLIDETPSAPASDHTVLVYKDDLPYLHKDDVEKLAVKLWKTSDDRTGEPPYMYSLGVEHGYNKAKETLYTKDQVMDELIGFQIFLNNKGHITNHDWDYEKLAKKYIKSLKQ